MHVAAPAVIIPMCIDFLVIIHSHAEGVIPVGDERARWCPSLEALPARCLMQTGSRDLAVPLGKDIAAKSSGVRHVGLLAAEYFRHNDVTIRIVVVPTCVSELADMNTTVGISWLHIKQSKCSRVWDIVSLTYAKVASHASQLSSTSP